MIKFDVPKSLIAQYPASPRDSAKLLVYDKKTAKITDAVFRDLNDHLAPDTTLVLNDSKVEHCRYIFPNNTEVFVLEKPGVATVKAMVRPGRRFKLSYTVQLAPEISAKVASIDADGFRTLELSLAHDDERLKKYEHVPLPPYIMQNDALADEYQTVYAREAGSKAAPTAGLHFTPELLEKVKASHGTAKITLHVGLGTFALLTVKQLKDKRLHAEKFLITANDAEKIRRAAHITAVGTTTTRVLETAARNNGLKGYLSGETDIFIQPGDDFLRTDALITNFHLPGTSLLLLVEAFVGSETEMLRIYRHALQNGYRFYSFGDVMLIK